MLSVPLAEEQLKPLLNDDLALAAVNTSLLCVVSGDEQSINAFTEKLKENGHEGTVKRLHTSHAFHSKMMDPLLKEFEYGVSKITLDKPAIPYISNLTGRWLGVDEALNPAYWCQHLRNTVRFADGLKELLKEANTLFVEVGPGRSLSTFVRQHHDKKPEQMVINLIRHPTENVSDVYYLSNQIGRLWLYGGTIDWKGFYAEEKRQRIPLPTYPFEGQPYWINADLDQIAGGKRLNIPQGKIKEMGARVQNPRPGLSSLYIAPGTEVEKTLVKIWEDLLGIHQLGTLDNFFELGGDSLKMMKMVSLIHKKINVKLTLGQVFETPRIRELAGLITGEKIDQYSSMEPVEKKEYYALSSAQKRMYIIHLMEAETCSYNLPVVVQLVGKPNREQLQDTFRILIKRHESLRTSFIMLKNEAVQVVHDIEKVEFAIEYYEFTSYPSAEKIIKDFIRPFNLSRTPLLRGGLVNLAKDKYLLMMDMHHIITDGVSYEILINHLAALYQGKALPGLRLQYKDYAEWQKNSREKEIIRQQEVYWLNQFSDPPPVLQIPTDYQRAEIQDFSGAHINFTLEEELWKHLASLAKATGTSLYMVLLTTLFILLHKYSKQEDIVVGSPITGRRHENLQDILGMFVNMLALRSRPEQDKTFKAFLLEVKETAFNAFENQDYQFEELVQKLGLQGETRKNPLFDVVLTMQNIQRQRNHLDSLTINSNLQVVPYQYDTGKSRFDLNLVVYEIDSRMHMRLEYSTQLFKPSTIEEFQKHYIEIIKQVLTNTDLYLKDIRLSHDLMKMETVNILEERGDFEF
jgi:malonyl CoA-acyl carrier protein transacylase